MGTLKAAIQRFGDRENRPLLHRKEEFLDPSDPDVDKYRRRTAAEMRAGLYQSPTVIGLEHGWTRELERCGVELRGHRVVKTRHSRIQRLLAKPRRARRTEVIFKPNSSVKEALDHLAER